MSSSIFSVEVQVKFVSRILIKKIYLAKYIFLTYIHFQHLCTKKLLKRTLNLSKIKNIKHIFQLFNNGT